MQLVLVAGLNPRVCNKGPNVLLGAGNYRIVTEGIVDSMITLGSNHDRFFQVFSKHKELASVFRLSEDMPVFVGLEKQGTEPFINVFVELINGADPTTT